jgi:hypothetical protein
MMVMTVCVAVAIVVFEESTCETYFLVVMTKVLHMWMQVTLHLIARLSNDMCDKAVVVGSLTSCKIYGPDLFENNAETAGSLKAFEGQLKNADGTLMKSDSALLCTISE